MKQKKILVVYGTRPEAIKMAPIVAAMKADDALEPVVAVTGQHRAILDQVNALFGIVPQYDLDIIQPGQTLDDIVRHVLNGLGPVLTQEAPDAVLVQGDTSTTFGAAMAAHHARIPVIHAEAGLRTGDRYNPFPEEMNRRLTSQLSSLHLAPTPMARDNLLRESFSPADVVVTGNTVIDALLHVVRRGDAAEDEALRRSIEAGPFVLVTSHRRESLGAPMERTAQAVVTLAREFRDHTFLLPLHPNPKVRQAFAPTLWANKNVLMTAPLGYSDMALAMSKCRLVLTDSGGIQEEAPSLGKPVLVLRDNTERPEAVAAGTARLVGTDIDTITSTTRRLLLDTFAYEEMARAVNPYGDGRAAERTVAATRHFFNLGPRAEEFVVERSMSDLAEAN